MAGGDQKIGDRGATLAIGIVLLWVGGFALFVAFMSGKTPSLTVGKNQDGVPQGPHDASQLVGRLAQAVQAAEGAAAPPTVAGSAV